MKKIICMIFIIVFMLVGCASNNPILREDNDSGDSSEETILNNLRLIFEQNGYTFSSESANKTFLKGERIKVTLNSQIEISIFLYDSKENADLDAQCISPDGFTITTTDGNLTKSTCVEWIAPPHFFKKDNLIFLYVGEEKNIINVLSSNFGTQIAGNSL